MIAQTLVEIASDVQKTTISTLTNTGDIASGSSFSSSSLANLPALIIGKLMKLSEDIYNLKKGSMPTSVAMGDNFELRMDNGFISIYCVQKDEHSARKDQMQSHIGELITAPKLISEAGLQTIIEGDLNSILEGGSFLAAAIFDPAINHVMDQMSKCLSIYEQSVLPDQCVYRSTDI